MAKKIEIIGQQLVITDTDTSSVLFEAPKADYYYKAKLLNQGIIKFYNLDVKDVTVGIHNIRLTDAVDSTDTPFTLNSFRTFARENLGFKVSSGSGGSGSISQNVQNYSSFAAGTEVNQLGYARESEGTAWLPFSLGGTYYPKGLYIWNGSDWVSDRNAIAAQLQTNSESGGGSSLAFLQCTGRWQPSNTTSWFTFDQNYGWTDFAWNFAVNDVAGSPQGGFSHMGFIIPQGWKVNKVVMTTRSTLSTMDINCAFLLRDNGVDTGDFANDTSFAFTELYNDKFFNNSVLPTLTAGSGISKRTFVMDDTGGINEADDQDKLLIPYFKADTATASVQTHLHIEIEKI